MTDKLKKTKNMKTFEIDENFKKVLIFEPKRIKDAEITMQERFVKHQRETLGIKVTSVVFPPNFTGDFKDENDVCDWLQNKVFSTERAYYNYAKMNQDIFVRGKIRSFFYRQLNLKLNFKF